MMDSRGTRSLGLLALRFLHRHRLAGSQRRLLSLSLTSGEGEEVAPCSSLEGGSNGAIQISKFDTMSEMLFEEDRPKQMLRYEMRSEKAFEEDLTSQQLRRFLGQVGSKQGSEPALLSRRNESVTGTLLGLQHLSSDKNIAARDGGAVSLTDEDFLSRYLQWRRFDRFAHLDSKSGSYATDVADMASATTQNWASLPNFFSSPSSVLHWDHIPMEASSVKRKRKKKMNKHKQRKLRRRDRHRN